MKTTIRTILLASALVNFGMALQGNALEVFRWGDTNDFSVICPPPIGREGRGGCCGVGMPDWTVTEPYINLWVKDQPLGYQPAKGPAVTLKIEYKQRNEGPGYSSNEFSFGKGWNCSWRSYAVNGAGGTTIYFPGGGLMVYSTINSINPNTYSRVENPNDGVYRVIFQDGHTNIYAMQASIDGETRFYLSESDDLQGNKLAFHYQNEGTTLTVARLSYLIDGDGRTNFLFYTNTTFSVNLVESVIDGFGRTNHFSYDTNGFLTGVKDVQGIASGFAYDGGGFMTNLITPYGITTFAYREGTNYDNYRWLRVTDAGGGEHLWLAAETIGFADTNYVYKGCSFYWGPRQFARLTQTNLINADPPLPFTENDYLRAKLKWWGGWGGAPGNPAHLLWQRDFSPDGVNPGFETDYWYESGDVYPTYVDSQNDDGSQTRIQTTWNDLGKPTEIFKLNDDQLSLYHYYTTIFPLGTIWYTFRGTDASSKIYAQLQPHVTL